MKTPTLAVVIIVFIAFIVDARKFNFTYPATPISGPLSVTLDNCDSTLVFYETEHLGHWIFGKTICRGRARMKHVRDELYQLDGELPGINCMDSISIYRIPQRGQYVDLYINLPKCKYNITIMAQPIGLNTIIETPYKFKSAIKFPVNKLGYRLAISLNHPLGQFPLNSYCFNNTIKFLLLPELDPSLFKSGCKLIIDIPFFNENCFFEWNIHGDIVRMMGDTIIFKNIEYVKTNN